MELSGFGYPCSAGETFDSVALAVYGDEKYAADLLNANPALCRKMVFTGGETLLLPVVYIAEDSYTDTAAPWKQ